MGKNFWQIINDVIQDADILVEVLDARLIDETRNIEIENKVLNANKPIVYVINKSDLASPEDMNRAKKKLSPCVFVSAKEKTGIKRLRTLILSKSGTKKQVNVGILGYPNVGKSSIINALSGSGGKAGTSSQSGFTKGKQDIKISKKLKVIDTPGVIPYKENDPVKHAMTATQDYAHIKEPDYAVVNLMRLHPGLIEEFYGIDYSDDIDESLDKIAIKLNKLKKGGEPDIIAASRIILKDWQSGTIKK
jgi:ribosome biogenesis GTPase A